METRERKKWDPNCQKCREELQRILELSAGIYDEVDHGGGLYPVRPPEYCDHEGDLGTRSYNPVGDLR